ncbi:DUF2000 domain-containing protein [Allosphingosinicella deserti]|uniref:DUF2000 domain-containing protein n=1 Tax=Allosphingosinicella deserti TaxID=2116704 RepID=A0A2P7QRD3_9SPHN|nr:DUF2000 domain-containing protein [Sphingomonas deserti]PSJ40536.1 DUF2000 domain-containing protein [Sphingomonas deserti]
MTELDGRRIAIVVDPSLPPGLIANTVAVIGIGLGAAAPWLGGDRLVDADGRVVMSSASRPVPVLQADAAALAGLLTKACPVPDGAVLVPFPHYARAIHDFAAFRDGFATHRLSEARIDGIGLAGPGKWVRSLTGSCGLLR